MAEGVHFDLSHTTPYQLGFKLISVNVSDIYAMGGKPLHMLLALALPPETETGFLDRLMDGVYDALKKYGASLAGGDISASPAGGMVLTASVTGSSEKPVLRSGARPGDSLYVTGSLGDSACGLELLKSMGKRVDLSGRKVRGPLKWNQMEPLLHRHLMPIARKPGPWLAQARAMMDISDGLLLDLRRMCIESGVGAKVSIESLPISKQMQESAVALGLDPHKLALTGGEDYELLFAARGSVQGRVKKIGEVVGGNKVIIVDKDGQESVWQDEGGYRHFSKNK
jgi:thiamine-monophosphate kinase